MGAARRCASRDLPLLAPPRMSVSIVEESGPQFKEPRTPQNEREERKTREHSPREGVGFHTICFRPKHSARLTRGRSPDSQVIAQPAAFPFRRTVACAGRSLLTVAGPCGIFTRFPFHSPQ